MLRAAFGRHLAEPAWAGFVRRLSSESPAFERMWSTHDVAEPGPHVKVLRYEEVGEIRLTTTTLTVVGMPEARLVVYTPAGEQARQRLAHLAVHPSRHCSLPEHGHARPDIRTEADPEADVAPTGAFPSSDPVTVELRALG
jgi:hypothetical protein